MNSFLRNLIEVVTVLKYFECNTLQYKIQLRLITKIYKFISLINRFKQYFPILLSKYIHIILIYLNYF